MYASKIKEKKFPWGATVLATPFAAQDTVSIVGSIAGGSRAAGGFDFAEASTGRQEFADIHAQMLLEGSVHYSKKEIQILLDSLGASLSFFASTDRLVFSAKIRIQHLERLLTLIADLLHEPTFKAKELAMLKKREHAELAMEAQDTRAQADIALSRLLFTPAHPNWEESTQESKATLESVTSTSLHAYHKKVLDVSTLVLSFAGDISPAHVFALTEKKFKKLPRSGFTLPVFTKEEVKVAQSTNVKIEHKANIDYMTGIATGITKKHHDYAPLMLGIQILGTPGFSGRMMKIIREVEGLTYGVYSYLSGFGNGVDGYISVWGTFAPELFEKGKAAIKREIDTLVSKGVTAVEVKKHRELFDARSRVQLSNSSAFARAAHDIVVDGFGLSHLDTFPKEVLTLTASQVNKILKKYLLPAQLSESAAGPIGKETLT